MDLKDIQGMESVKRALEVSIVGLHPINLYGNDGYGKSTIIKAFRQILNEIIETNILKYSKTEPFNFVNIFYKSKYNNLMKDKQMFIEVRKPCIDDLFSTKVNQSSEIVKERVIKAISFYEDNTFFNCNLDSDNINKLIKNINKNDTNIALLKQFLKRHDYNYNIFHNILKVSKSIAFLEGTKDIKSHHLAEAMQYSYCANIKKSE